MNSRSLGAAIFGLLLLCCGQSGSTLSGSIAQTTALSFDSVQVREVVGSYTVTYLRGQETVARLVYSPGSSARPQPGQSVMLTFGNNGNAAISRATSDGLVFPAAQSGNLTFDTDIGAATDGTQVSGHFGVLFTGGQTLSGTFAGTLSVATLKALLDR